MGIRHWLLARLPAGLVVHPAEWFLAVLCLISGLTIVTGVSHPSSVARLLWRPVYYAWGASLLLGSIALIIGLSSIHWAPGTDLYVVRRVPVYRLGLRLLGAASAAYAIGLFAIAGLNATLAVAVVLAFAATCALRLLTLKGDR